MSETTIGRHEMTGEIADQLMLRCLGLQPYAFIWERMKGFTQERDDQAVDEFWLLEHPPVFTQGQAGKSEHLLMPGDIPVVKVDRGGQVTYHGPGQLVIYLLLDLKRKNLGVRALVDIIEQSIIGLLATLGINAELQSGAPGVYVDGAKIASLGLRVRRGCSFHGLSLNIDMDLSPFRRINPCGYQGLRMVQLKDLSAGLESLAPADGAIFNNMESGETIAASDDNVVMKVGHLLSQELVQRLGYSEIFVSSQFGEG